VDAVVGALAVAGDAAAAVDVLVVVPGDIGAVLGVHRDRGPVGVLAAAPVVVVVGEDGGGGAGEADAQHAQVGPAGRAAGVGAAAGGVLDLVPRTRGGGLQRDGAAVQRLA